MKCFDNVEWKKKHGVIPVLSEDKKTITYGLYPQTVVNDAVTIDELNKLTKVESNGWYLYNEEYYAKLEAKPERNIYKFNNGTTIVKGKIYWFKCEPITLNVLSNVEGKYFILSFFILDAHRYDDSSNNYKNSEIRAWLNGDFYNSAFNLGNEYIQTTIVDNSTYTVPRYSDKFVCDNTNDKVFLPSYKDYENKSYGFISHESRQCKTTDYARANGARYVYNLSYLNNGFYWTRSPRSCLNTTRFVYGVLIGQDYGDRELLICVNSGYVWYVDSCGRLDSCIDSDLYKYYGNDVSDTFYGVRPCLYLDLDIA